MRERRIPASLMWLIALAGLAVAAAIVAGVLLYDETRYRAQVQAEAMTRGDAAAGATAIARAGCSACHRIPGIAGAEGSVGPDLRDVGKRAALAGSLVNDPETMVRWLRHPQALRPGSAMPEMGLSEREARDIAAYLYARR